MTRKEMKLLEVALQSAVERVGGTAEFVDGKLVLGGACAACPLEICNDTIELTSSSEIEVSPYHCPTSGCECPLYIYFTQIARFLWRETGGYKDDAEEIESFSESRIIRWPLIVDNGEVRENFPIFNREKGKFRIVRWEESVSECDVFEVKEQVFPFTIELRR